MIIQNLIHSNGRNKNNRTLNFHKKCSPLILALNINLFTRELTDNYILGKVTAPSLF